MMKYSGTLLTLTECSFILDSVIKMRMKDLDKQQRIKDAMVRLILRDGIDGVSVSKIAREAGVSPATIYVYYNSKDEMLSEVFQEYSRRPYQYLVRQVRPDMEGPELIETIVRGSYAFSTEHEEVFSFVEQCSRCPTLSARVCEEECSCDVLDLLHGYQARGVLKPCNDWTLGAMLFAPVRFLALNRRTPEPDSELDELVNMLQDLLLN